MWPQQRGILSFTITKARLTLNHIVIQPLSVLYFFSKVKSPDARRRCGATFHRGAIVSFPQESFAFVASVPSIIVLFTLPNLLGLGGGKRA